jgi:hypothetical protein
LAVAECGYSVLTAVIAVVKSAVIALSCIATVNPFLSIKKSGLDILLTGYNNLTLQTY